MNRCHDTESAAPNDDCSITSVVTAAQYASGSPNWRAMSSDVTATVAVLAECTRTGHVLRSIVSCVAPGPCVVAVAPTTSRAANMRVTWQTPLDDDLPAYSRAMTLRHCRRLLLIVGVETLSSLHAEASVLDVLLEQFPRANWKPWTDRRIVLFDVEDHIETNFVHQAEWSAMSSQQNLEDVVDLGRRRHAFFDNSEGFAFHGRPDAIENESDAFSPHMERDQSVQRHPVHQIRDDAIGRLSTRRDLDRNLLRGHVVVCT